jgi:hypothetical protein
MSARLRDRRVIDRLPNATPTDKLMAKSMFTNLVHAQMVYRVPAGRSLNRLHALSSLVLCATGARQFVASFDGGASWKEHREHSFGDSRVLAVVACESAALAFIETASDTEIWTGFLGQASWELISRLPLCTSLAVRSSIGKTVVVACKEGEDLYVYSSNDSGRTWDAVLHLPFPGTLTHFDSNKLGHGLVIMLDTRTAAEGVVFESTIITLDTISGRVKDTRALRANIQSACWFEASFWLIGADYGTLFSYDSDTLNLETKMIFEDERLNISAIDCAAGKVCLVAETSDPPPDIFVIEQGGSNQWTSRKSDISSYVWGHKRVRDGIVILTETNIYKLPSQP